MKNPPVVPVDKYRTPAEAIFQLEILRAQIIDNNNRFYEFLQSQEVTFNKETMEYEEEFHTNEYTELFLTGIYGNLDRSSPIIRRTFDLKNYYESVNRDLEYDNLEARYKITVEGIEVVAEQGNMITYRPTYSVNTDEIPEDYRSKAIDEMPTSSRDVAVRATLAKYKGNWIIAESTNTPYVEQ